MRLGRLNAALIVVSAITVVNAAWYAHRGPRFIEPKKGDSLDWTIRFPNAASSVRISDVASLAACTDVVIYEPTCGGCVALAHEWKQDLIRTGNPFPRRWQAVWLSVLDSAHAATFELPGTPVRAALVFAHNGRPPRMSQYPWHVVLDHSGRVVSWGGSAELMTSTDYGAECSIRHPSDHAE